MPLNKRNYWVRISNLAREEISPYLRSRQRKPFSIQMRELISLWKRDRRAPVTYLRARLYEKQSPPVSAHIPFYDLKDFRNQVNSGIDCKIVRDKGAFAALMRELDLPVVPELFTTDASGAAVDADNCPLARDEAAEILRNFHQPLFVKPRTGRGGAGAFLLHPGEDVERVFDGKPRIVQPALSQHSMLAAIYPNAINTVRIDTLTLGGETVVNAAILRLGQNGIIVDSSALGGLAAPIDLETGRISGLAHAEAVFDPLRTGYRHHPNTGHPIIGVMLPFWSAVMTLVQQAAHSFTGDKSLGWDIALTPDGPVIIEANDSWDVRRVQDHCPLDETSLGRACRIWRKSGQVPDYLPG